MINELKDARPPVELPPNHTVLFILLALLLLAGLLFLFKFLSDRWKNKKAVPIVIRPAWELAKEELAALNSENLVARGEVKEYFVRLSGIVRHYLERRFSLSAPEMTTDEFLVYLRTTPVLTAGQKEALKEFLTASDMVKFAKHGSSLEEMEKAFHMAERLVEETVPVVPKSS